MCTYGYICTYLRRALFQNIISELGIGINCGLALSAFWKRALHMLSYQERHNIVTVHIHSDYNHAVPLEHQLSDTMSQYPTQSCYPDTKVTRPFPVLVMLSGRLDR